MEFADAKEPVIQKHEKTSSMSSPMWLKYHNSMADAFADLGRPEEVGKVFVGFQKYRYQL